MQEVSLEEKLSVIKRRLEEYESWDHISKTTGIPKSTVRDWCRRYESMGTEAFLNTGCKKYSIEFKENAVKHYLEGHGSVSETCKFFQIRSATLLRQWIQMYNSHNLKASPEGKVKTVMTKSRKTTLEERIRIVEEHIRSDASYAQTAEKHNVSYQQVYRWIQKYKAKGIDGLIDRRGRSKPVEDMTEIERLQAENRILKAQLERKELENIFLKKVDEIERRRS